MDRDDIKRQLAGYRPELYDDDDPLIASALRQAKSDPELSAWLEDEVLFDREFARQLGAVEPPAGAMEKLLDEAASEVGVRPRRTRRAWLAAAAALVILGAAAVKYFVFPPPVEFPPADGMSLASFRDHMALFANERFVLDKRFEKLGDSSAWLSEQQFPSFKEVPGQIVRFEGLGCKKIDWRGTKVGLICFRNDGGQVVHLFVIEESVFSDLAAPASPLEVMLVQRGLETGGWRAEGKVMLLVGSEPEVAIGGLL